MLHVAEIGGRRLLLFAAARGFLARRPAPVQGGWLRRMRFRRVDRDTAAASAARPPSADQPPSAPVAVHPARVAPSDPAASPLARAKAKARGRMRK
jgi:hypothetical protein